MNQNFSMYNHTHTPLTAFIEENGADTLGRTRDAILAFNNEALELDHYYIQWLFPLETMSENVTDAPILTPEEKRYLRTSLRARDNILRALARITQFYAETSHWLEYDNHNHLRITRILIATRSILGHHEAQEFYNSIIGRIRETGAHISPYNRQYWDEAIGLIVRPGTKIYLDIDGTLIHEDLSERYGMPAEGLEDFIIALRRFDVYWLTTHCMDGDPRPAQNKLKAVLPEELHGDIERIQPTAWLDLKTEALDWNSDFIWFDNEIFDAEWNRFKGAEIDQRVIEVNLMNNPRHLIEITNDILI